MLIADVADKKIILKHISGPTGVRGRNSDNRLIEEKLGWKPNSKLREGIESTYKWIKQQVDNGIVDPIFNISSQDN